MIDQYSAPAKVYSTEKLGKLSILDMLKYFEEKGAMRVSDLHIKIGAPPAYRIDGSLVKLKGIPVTPQIAKALIYPLLSDKNLNKLQSNYSVDCSYRTGNLQFRINVFMENDGICAAIRALELTIPKVEHIGLSERCMGRHHRTQAGTCTLNWYHRRRKINNCRIFHRPNRRKNRLPNHHTRRPYRIHLPAEILPHLAARGRQRRQLLRRWTKSAAA